MVLRPEATYEERFDDVMLYVKMRLKGGGQVRFGSKEDIRKTIIALDNARQTKGKRKISDTFLNKILNTRSAQKAVGTTIGGFRRVRQRQPTLQETERVTRLKQQGIEVFKTGRGNPVRKAVVKGPKGAISIRFRDVNTGRFVKRTEVLTQ